MGVHPHTPGFAGRGEGWVVVWNASHALVSRANVKDRQSFSERLAEPLTRDYAVLAHHFDLLGVRRYVGAADPDTPRMGELA